ncbi:MAG: hypothetical protein ABIH23_01540, partial [bacterium]
MDTWNYDWKRFWRPKGGDCHLSPDGFLWDPESSQELSRSLYSHLEPLESLFRFPCLVLLGEPGIGKTETMNRAREVVDQAIREQGHEVFSLDLGSYSSEDRLVHALEDIFEVLVSGNRGLHLFLDSLDECMLRIETVAALLCNELEKYPIDRLFIRIACRTAVWPALLENDLKKLWKKESVGMYEILPLRRKDVEEAAKTRGLCPEKFVNAVLQREVVPLAIKPITLDMLLGIYQEGAELPRSSTDLYHKGCLYLCEERNQSRIASGRRGTLSAEQRMATAAHIAAITTFCNRNAIWRGIQSPDIRNEDATIQDLCGDTKSADGRFLSIEDNTIRETLDTGLFSSRDAERMGWAHQTYAEFLAAEYVHQCGMTLPQIRSLIVHADGKLVPQIHETAAWLAGMMPEVFHDIMKREPEILLRSDVATADVEDRKKLVDALLQGYEKEELLDLMLVAEERSRKLTHPDLTEQLRPYLCDSNRGTMARKAAIEIATVCHLTGLQEILGNIALDNYDVRRLAARAVARIGDNETRKRLRPLASGEAGEDPKDELKGYALSALWPNLMTADELFRVLTPPKQSMFFGAYSMFLNYELPDALRPSDLPVALKWVRKRDEHHKSPFDFERMIGKIMRLAWEHLESPGVINAFAETALYRAKQDQGIFPDHNTSELRTSLTEQDDKRYAILVAVIPFITDPKKDAFYLSYYGSGLLQTRDIPWMIERLHATDSKDHQKVWSELIREVFDWKDRVTLHAVWNACRENPILDDVFAPCFHAVEIHSDRARQLREDYECQKKRRNRFANHRLLEPPPKERVAMQLEGFESGDLRRWHCLIMEMTLKPDSREYKDELDPDMTTLPGWEEADNETRTRILQAARVYLLNGNPETQEWLGTNDIHWSAWDGYKAIRL